MISLELISFFSFFTIRISTIYYVLGGLLEHGVWDSFVDFPYGILSLF